MELHLVQPELQLRFPSDLERTVVPAVSKVVHALWHEGEQCYCNLKLLTGLPRAELNDALHRLLEIGWIERHEAAIPPGLAETDDMSRFVLTDEVFKTLRSR